MSQTGKLTRGIIKDTLFPALKKFGVKSVMTAITAKVPFLGLPVVRQIVSFFVEKILWFFLEFAQDMLVDLVIEIEVQQEKKAVIDAVKKAKELPQDATEKQIKDARKDLFDAWDGFLSSGVRNVS